MKLAAVALCLAAVVICLKLPPSVSVMPRVVYPAMLPLRSALPPSC